MNVGLWIDGVVVDSALNVYQPSRINWQIPNTPTDNARFIIFTNTPNYPRDQHASSRPFQIIEPTDSCTIVVLGSETAAGTGPRATDSTWVNRFRRSYKQYDTRVEVVNLAQADHSTFQLLPTGTAISSGINETIDEEHNITAALALNPQAIIINLESADALRGYGASQQLDNYAQIMQAAGNVPVYITTPQPGDHSPSVQNIQREMVDRIPQIYGDRAIDFWTPLEGPNDKIDSLYSAVNGLQANNAGHRMLWQNVFEKQIDTLLTCQRTSSTSAPRSVLPLSLKLAPNPAHGETTLSFSLKEGGQVSIEVYNLMGQLVKYLAPIQYGLGEQRITLYANEVPTGMYTLRAEVYSQGEKKQVGVVKLVME